MSPIRILHASDLHIAQAPSLISPIDKISPGTFVEAVTKRTFASSFDPAVLERFTSFVYNKMGGQIDAVLLTGDIATTGLPHDLEVARRFIEGPPHPRVPALNTRMEPTLAGLGMPVWLLPGNHDRYIRTKLLDYSPGGTRFDYVFGAYWKGHVQAFPLISHADIHAAIIAADFNLKSKKDSTVMFGKYAQGRAYTATLDHLEQATTSIKNNHAQQRTEALAIVWALHFPPKYPGISRAMQLINSRELIDRANQCGVHALLAGHTHQPVAYRTPDMRFDVFCAGTTSQHHAPHGNHFQIINISLDAQGKILISSENYRFKGIPTSRFVKL
jgi:UDP-2,3-diacylglucosamine pyrophosphatase LpxH